MKIELTIEELKQLSRFIEIKEKKTTLEAIMERSKELLEERKQQKKKPLKSLENILNGVTDGIQGKDIYEINKKIIDLSEPLLTDEARDGMKEEMYAPLNDEGRDIKNVYEIISKNSMYDLMNEKIFGNVFGFFERIIKMEKKFSQKNATF